MSLFNILSNVIKNLTKDDNQIPPMGTPAVACSPKSVPKKRDISPPDKEPDFSIRSPYQLKDSRERLRMALQYHRQSANFIEDFLETTKHLYEEASNLSGVGKDENSEPSETGLVRVILPEEETPQVETSSDEGSENTDVPNNTVSAPENLNDKIVKLRKSVKVRNYKLAAATSLVEASKNKTNTIPINKDDWERLTKEGTCYYIGDDAVQAKIIMKPCGSMLYFIVYSRAGVLMSRALASPVKGEALVLISDDHKEVISAMLDF